MISRAAISAESMLWPAIENDQIKEKYELTIESFFGEGKAYTFWKGRVALYAILKALGVGPGDEVIMPGYTCVMAAGPVMYCGATPLYADIDRGTYNLRVEEVLRLINSRTKVILVQHTYGIPAPIEEICKISAEHGISVVEDCCHTFGGRQDGKLLGTFGKASFFSGQWNKPFNTGLGGIALVNDPDLALGVSEQQVNYPPPGRKSAFLLSAQLLAYELLVFPSITPKVTSLFRFLTHKGLVVGSSNSQEFGADIPVGYARKASPVQYRLGRSEILRIEENNKKRKMISELYFHELPKLGYRLPTIPRGSDPIFLRFPVRVENKEEALKEAGKYGVEIGSWFECPLHPMETDQKIFGYTDGQCPEAEKAAAEVINLPTHRRVGDKDIAKTLEYLRKVCRPAQDKKEQPGSGI
jgi:perosamine synthetase